MAFDIEHKKKKEQATNNNKKGSDEFKQWVNNNRDMIYSLSGK